MSEKNDTKQTTLFFVKNLSHHFAPVEKFLKKRGYNMFVETDIKIALDRISEENPEYIFLAWDHENENIRLMPKTIYQSCTGSVVPFIMSTQRDQIMQIEYSGFENKLYPPLSGPAIIRMILKCEKKHQILNQIDNKKVATAKKESDMIQVKSFFLQENDQNPEIKHKELKNDIDHERKLTANRSREKLNAFVSRQKKLPTSIAHSIVQEGFISKMKNVIEEQIGKLSASSTTAMEIELTVDQGISLSSDTHSTSELLSRESKSLSSEQIAFLDQSFAETVKPEIFDVIENYADQKTDQVDLSKTTQIYVLVVQELEWTGYLIVASENYLDIASAQVILNNWIKQMIHVEQIDQQGSDQRELPDTVLFEIHVPKVDFAEFCSYKSDFFKDVEYEGKKTMIGFFSLSSFEVLNSIHSVHDMLEIPKEFLQPNKELPFDVNLYLPENQKFILYNRPGSFLDSLQVARLQTSKVKHIFTNMDYELALLKYKAEFNINKLIDIYHKIRASKK